jgi:DNA invertase Pin-like site-specific DNA recombinase
MSGCAVIIRSELRIKSWLFTDLAKNFWIDRLGRSLKDLIDWVNYLEKEKVALRSLQESIDTTTPTGKLIFHLFGALADFERNLIVERTNAGLTAARARGIKGGRKPKLDASKQKTA